MTRGVPLLALYLPCSASSASASSTPTSTPATLARSASTSCWRSAQPDHRLHRAVLAGARAGFAGHRRLRRDRDPQQRGRGPAGFLGGLFAGGVLAALVGLLDRLPTLRLRGDYLAIATLGMAEIDPGRLREPRQLTTAPRA